MPAEHQPTPATIETNHTNLEAAARARLEQLQSGPEAAPEQPADQRAELAREVINRPEPESAPEPAPAAHETAAPAGPGPGLAAHLDRALNYRHTLASVQRHLGPAGRTFSQVIHTPAVERVSEALEHNVARPSVLAGATWGAAIVGLIFYLTARLYGFALSGSEMLVALLAGGLIGLVIEGLSRAFRRPRR